MMILANLQEQSPYAIGWGTLALINAGLAQGKNRSGLNWFLLSLLLGPLATFFVVISDPIEPKSMGTLEEG
jgi:hypothetical protein